MNSTSLAVVKKKGVNLAYGLSGVASNVYRGYYQSLGKLIGVKPEEMDRYLGYIEANPSLKYLAPILDVADLIPVVSQASMIADGAYLKALTDYARREIPDYKPDILQAAVTEVVGALVPCLPIEWIPTVSVAYAKACRDMSRHKPTEMQGEYKVQ